MCCLKYTIVSASNYEDRKDDMQICFDVFWDASTTGGDD